MVLYFFVGVLSWGVVVIFLGVSRDFGMDQFLENWVNFYEVNINVGDALIFNISNIKRKIKLKN